MTTDFLETEQVDGVWVIRLCSRPFDSINHDQDPKLETALIQDFRSRLKDVSGSLVIDLKEVGFISSHTLNVLVRMFRDLPDQVTGMSVCGLGYASEIWDLMKFSEFIGPCFETQKEAIDAAKM